MKKAWTLRFIQAAWVVEVGILVLYTLGIVPCLDMERVNLWLKALPVLGGLIGTQGAAAGIGPLVADHIKSRNGGSNEHTVG